MRYDIQHCCYRCTIARLFFGAKDTEGWAGMVVVTPASVFTHVRLLVFALAISLWAAYSVQHPFCRRWHFFGATLAIYKARQTMVYGVVGRSRITIRARLYAWGYQRTI